MSEVIKEIREVKERQQSDYGTEQGFIVNTNRRSISLMIDNDVSCCERWGYLITEDTPSKFLGSHLLDIRTTDTNRIGKERVDELYLGDGEIMFVEIMFVDFVTDKGTFQIAAYNGHNGYYGHEVRLTSAETIERRVL